MCYPIPAPNSAHNQVVTTNIWGLDLSDTLHHAGGVGGLLSVTILSGEPENPFIIPMYYSLCDANGNVTAYLNSTGGVAFVSSYDPFGRTIKLTTSLEPTSPNLLYGFSSKYWDTETGLYYYGYRFYSPNIGRWLSRDLIDEVGGINLYNSFNCDAINNFDPYGLSVPSVPVILERLGKVGLAVTVIEWLISQFGPDIFNQHKLKDKEVHVSVYSSLPCATGQTLYLVFEVLTQKYSELEVKTGIFGKGSTHTFIVSVQENSLLSSYQCHCSCGPMSDWSADNQTRNEDPSKRSTIAGGGSSKLYNVSKFQERSRSNCN